MAEAGLVTLGLTLSLLTSPHQVGGDRTDSCRDSWVQRLAPADFDNLTCSKCLVQLFNNRLPLTMPIPPWPPRPPFALVLKGANVSGEVFPDPEARPSLVCRLGGLDAHSCDRWRACCRAASTCCQRMVHWQHTRPGVGECPGTWDGIACWDPTPAGTLATQLCPAYYGVPEALWTAPHARRSCTPNGTWSLDPRSRLEKTDVVPCVDTTAYKRVVLVSLYIDIAGNVLSVVALVTSIVVIVGFRSLRRDLLSRDSLKLHLNLFVAMILAGLTSLALHYIYFDKDIIKLNPVWCRVLYALSRYCRSVTYMAIFAEGLYLHRRISRVLYVSRREPLLRYFVITWVVPTVTVVAFSVTRVVLDQNQGCWMHPANSMLDFIYMVPNALTIVCNVGFLIGIEVNLCTKMRTDSSDRRVEVLRHALRATLTLIPMFGLQFFFLAYRPESWPPYEIIHALFISTQGFLVAVLYCLSTKEVRSQLYVVGRRCTVTCSEACRRAAGRGVTSAPGSERGGRRESASSAFRERCCVDRDGYLYMCRRQARPSVTSAYGYKARHQGGRHSLPDVIDSMSMTQTTRTTSLASSLCDVKDSAPPGGGGGRGARRVSHDLGSVAAAVSMLQAGAPRRPSAMSLGLPCACGARPSRPCVCAAGTRTSLQPLLGMSSSDHSSTSDVGPLEERQEEEEAEEEGQGVGGQGDAQLADVAL